VAQSITAGIFMATIPVLNRYAAHYACVAVS